MNAKNNILRRKFQNPTSGGSLAPRCLAALGAKGFLSPVKQFFIIFLIYFGFPAL